MFCVLLTAAMLSYILCQDASTTSQRDKAAEQLSDYAKAQEGQVSPILMTPSGQPIANKLAALTVGKNGPMLLQDIVYLEEIAHFDRERIPERVVHAKGAGAFGYFEVTQDISSYTRAKLFNKIGKQTPVAVRFSFVGGEQGSADTIRDPRGFAIKFYTEEGNWDLVGLNTPIYFIRDPLMFSSFIHSQKRNPVTHLKDKDMYWDFLSLRPETTYQVLLLFSDGGIPDGYRHMNGYGAHTFKLATKVEAVYCKFHFKTDQGLKNLTVDAAHNLTASDPDYANRDLYNAIASGQFPSWTFSIQVMTPEQAQTTPFNPFDVTKVWPEEDFPLMEVGKLVLNRNPTNYFSEVEQLAFSPSNMVQGIEPSVDRMLQGRLFSYPDSQRYRLGTNFEQIPVNCPYKITPKNYERDGPLTVTNNQEGGPNYYPNSFLGPVQVPYFSALLFHASGEVDRYSSKDDDNFSQPEIFYKKVLNDDERRRLEQNIADHLSGAQEFIQDKAVANFAKVDEEFSKRIAALLNPKPKQIA